MSKRSHSVEDTPRKQLRPEDEDRSGGGEDEEEVEDAVAGPSQRPASQPLTQAGSSQEVLGVLFILWYFCCQFIDI